MFMEPLLCARHPARDGRAWPGQHTHRFPGTKASPLVQPRALPQPESLSHSQCPQVTFSGILCTCFGSTIRFALKQKTKSESFCILLSHIFQLWWKLISVAWPRQWEASHLMHVPSDLRNLVLGCQCVESPCNVGQLEHPGGISPVVRRTLPSSARVRAHGFNL